MQSLSDELYSEYTQSVINITVYSYKLTEAIFINKKLKVHTLEKTINNYLNKKALHLKTYIAIKNVGNDIIQLFFQEECFDVIKNLISYLEKRINRDCIYSLDYLDSEKMSKNFFSATRNTTIRTTAYNYKIIWKQFLESRCYLGCFKNNWLNYQYEFVNKFSQKHYSKRVETKLESKKRNNMQKLNKKKEENKVLNRFLYQMLTLDKLEKVVCSKLLSLNSSYLKENRRRLRKEYKEWIIDPRKERKRIKEELFKIKKKRGKKD